MGVAASLQPRLQRLGKHIHFTVRCSQCNQKFATRKARQNHRCTPNSESSATNESTEATQSIDMFRGSIHICTGDITKQKMDAIVVLSTSDQLTKYVLQQAGESVSKTYNKDRLKQPNTSILTENGRLGCKRIFFIPSSKMSADANKWVFRNFVSEAIRMLIDDKTTTIRSIVFPAIGCGQYKCNPTFVAKTLMMAVAYELEKKPWLQLAVYFIIQPEHQIVLNAFENQLRLMKTHEASSANHHPTPIATHIPSKPQIYRPKDDAPVLERRVVNRRSSEYTKVANQFLSTMTNQFCKEIVLIENIRNKRWFKQYMVHRDDFNQRLKENTEKLLFHGCSENSANNIVKECFNRSYAGIHGVSCGYGVYFSSKASYSHHYTHVNTQGARCMFLARVLIGKTTLGNSSMKICPIGFDSTTDGSHIFVTYHDAQAFGEYLITYK